MSGNRYTATTEGESALVAATSRTVLQIRGLTTVNPSVYAWGVSFKGIVSADPPVLVRLLTQSTDGTATGCTETGLIVGLGGALAAPLTTVFRTFTSTEPTAGPILEMYEVHPQGGNLIREYPPGREIVLAAATTARLAIECLASASVSCVAWFQWEE